MKRNYSENRQKRVVKLKSRNINIGGYREQKDLIIIFANKNIRITQEQIKSIKTDITTQKGLSGGLIDYFNINLTIIPNKILTNKGILVRMGKGKGKVKTLVKYLTKGTRCVELIPKEGVISNPNVITKILKKCIKKYTFLSYKTLI